MNIRRERGIHMKGEKQAEVLPFLIKEKRSDLFKEELKEQKRSNK